MSTSERQIRWRCRRGMKELDVLLERFLEVHYDAASSDDRRAFAALLELPDPELAAYLLGHVVPTQAAFARLTRLIAARGD